ncbi:hypothetical protein [Segatella copri]|nr:hypothetical protein [Segatella copri]
MYQIVCDRCGEVFGGTDTCSALFHDKSTDIEDFSNWKMIDGKHYCPVCDGVRSLIECIHLKKKIVMATYRIVDMYRKSKAVKGIHYDSEDNPILAYRVDKRHSLLFGLIHYWDYGAYNLCPDYLFSSINKAKEAILKVDKSKKITILYE